LGAPHYLRNFYVRRALRILPLYYLVVFVSLVVLPALPHPKLAHFSRIEGWEWAYWLPLSNLSVALGGFHDGILDVTWSLAVQIQFYIAWPLVVMACSRQKLVRVCLGMFVFSLVAKVVAIFGLGLDPQSV
jgi:peptidoglycan/LPS O-acetylase OafA/YrhL